MSIVSEAIDFVAKVFSDEKIASGINEVLLMEVLADKFKILADGQDIFDMDKFQKNAKGSNQPLIPDVVGNKPEPANGDKISNTNGHDKDSDIIKGQHPDMVDTIASVKGQ